MILNNKIKYKTAPEMIKYFNLMVNLKQKCDKPEKAGKVNYMKGDIYLEGAVILLASGISKCNL